MRALLQRVSCAQVSIAGACVGKIGPGLLVFLGVGAGDTERDADYLAERCVKLRIFRDENDKMNHSLLSVSGEILIVSQFTLYADTAHGLRPGYSLAAAPEEAKRLYEYFIGKIRSLGFAPQTGEFGADMDVELVNQGPVTMLLESKK